MRPRPRARRADSGPADPETERPAPPLVQVRTFTFSLCTLHRLMHDTEIQSHTVMHYSTRAGRSVWAGRESAGTRYAKRVSR